MHRRLQKARSFMGILEESIVLLNERKIALTSGRMCSSTLYLFVTNRFDGLFFNGAMDFEFESFPEVEDVALASKFLHAYLLNAPDGAFKPSLGLCATSLTVDSALHSTLKAIHRKRDLDAFEHLRGASIAPPIERPFSASMSSLSQTELMAFSSFIRRDEPSDSRHRVCWEDR